MPGPHRTSAFDMVLMAMPRQRRGHRSRKVDGMTVIMLLGAMTTTRIVARDDKKLERWALGCLVGQISIGFLRTALLANPKAPKIGLRWKPDLVSQFKRIAPASCRRKKFLFTKNRNHAFWCVSRSDQRGVSRSSRTLAAGCDGRGCISRRGIWRGRRNRVVLIPRRWDQVC